MPMVIPLRIFMPLMVLIASILHKTHAINVNFCKLLGICKEFLHFFITFVGYIISNLNILRL